MSRSHLSALRAVFVLLLAGFYGFSPLSARGQFATLLDTTSRYAGNSTGTAGYNQDSGVATATALNVPTDVVMDSHGNLYISDAQNNCVRKVDSSGNITTVAGVRVNGGPDTCNIAVGSTLDPNNGLEGPTGLAIDGNNTLYIVDGQHNCVLSLAYGAVDSYAAHALTTVAGTCGQYNNSSTPSPIGLAVDSNSNLYISLAVADGGIELNQVALHKFGDLPTNVCAVAGQLSTYAYGASSRCTGITSTVTLNRPAGIAFDKNGNLYIADSSNNCVREILGMTTPQTVVGKCVSDQSSGNSTVLSNPYGLGFSADGSLFISESGTNHNVVSYNFGTGTLTPIAGLSSGASGAYNTSQEGQSALLVPLNQPLGVTTDAGGSLYLADSQNNVVRKMGDNVHFPDTLVGLHSVSQTLVFSINQTVNLSIKIGTDFSIISNTCIGNLTTAVGTCQMVIQFWPTRPGYRYSYVQLIDSISGTTITVSLEGNGIGPLSLLTPGVASTRGAGLRTAVAVSTDVAGGAYVLEQGNGSTTADVLYYPAGGGAAQVVVAQGKGLVNPTAMAVDGAGNIYVANTPTGVGASTSIARFGVDGSINFSYATGLLYVNSMTIDGFGNLYVAMGGSVHNVTEIYAGGQQRVVMGNGSSTPANGALAAGASLHDPSAVAYGPNGLTVADAGTHYVYTINSSGIINIVAGNGTTTTTNASLATGTGLNTPDGLAVDAAGDIYIADDGGDRVYEVYSTTSNGVNIASIIGTGVTGYTGDGGPSTAATLAGPVAIALDGSADLFIVDNGNSALREVTYPATSTINFGNVIVGTTSNPVLQYVTNAGNTSLTLTPPFTTTDLHYAVSLATTTCTNLTAPGAVCDIGYTYTPTAVGAAPAGQSNLPSNSYNSVQIVYFNAYGYNSGQSLPYTLINPETEVYGSPFNQSLLLTLVAPFIDPTGAIAFSVGAETTCTISGPFASGIVNCAAPNSGLAVGNYTVNFHYTTGDINYTSATGQTTLNVTPAPLTFNAGQYSRAYGAANPVFSPQVINGANGDSFTVTYTTPASATSPVGSYPITAQLTPVGTTNLANYTVTNTAGTLTVKPAPLMITVNNATRAYGAANPTFTGTVGGLLNGDTVTVAYSTTATIGSPVGGYSITASVTGATAANYTVQVVPGTLSITPVATVTTVTTNGTPANQGTNIIFTATVTYGANLPVPATTVNFYNGSTLLGTGSLNASGVATFSTSALTAGTYTITATYQASTDFATSSGTVQQVVSPGTFTLTATPASQFIRGAGTTVYAITVNSVQGFAGPVTLTCTGSSPTPLPADASCTFATPTVTLASGGSATTTMTVYNTEADACLQVPTLGSPTRRTPGGFSPIAFAAVFPFGALFAVLLRRKRGNRKGESCASRAPRIGLLLVLLCSVGIIGIAGCACRNSVNQTYTIPVTGTDITGTITQTTGTASNSPTPTLTVAQQQ